MKFSEGDKAVAHFPTGDPDYPRVAVLVKVVGYAPSGKVRILSPLGRIYTAAEDRLTHA